MPHKAQTQATKIYLPDINQNDPSLDGSFCSKKLKKLNVLSHIRHS